MNLTDIACVPILIVMADHTKLGKAASVRIAPATAMHTLVTDTLAATEKVEELRQYGIQVVLA